MATIRSNWTPVSTKMVISFIGYEEITQKITLEAGANTTMNIEMEPASTILQTATVTSGKYEKPLGGSNCFPGSAQASTDR